MMKTKLLLAFAVLVSAASVKEDKTLLGELFRKLGAVLINLTESERKEILLENLNMDCTFSKLQFCQAEQEVKKVSELTKYDDFPTDAVSRAPVKEENTSAKEENTSVKQENTSVKEENTSVKQENTSVKEENTSVKQENTSVKEENTSVKEQKILLRELVRKLDGALKNLPLEPEGNEIFLEDLKIDVSCSCLQFCQAEQELKKVSGLTKYDDFRTDGTLMKVLHMYNEHHGTICRTVAKGPVLVPLRDFLKSLKKCVQNQFFHS